MSITDFIACSSYGGEFYVRLCDNEDYVQSYVRGVQFVPAMCVEQSYVLEPIARRMSSN